MTETVGSLLELVAALASLAGALFFFASAVGMVRLPDFYTRLHAPTKAATLGVLLLAVGSLLRSLPQGQGVWLEELLIIVFLFLTVPVSAQVMARAAARRRLPQDEATAGRPPEEEDGEAAGGDDSRIS